MLGNNPYIQQMIDGIKTAEEKYFNENKIYKEDFFMELPEWVADPFQIVGIVEVDGFPYEKSFVMAYEPISNQMWNFLGKYVFGEGDERDTEFDENKKYKEIVVYYGENKKEYFEDNIILKEINNDS